MKETVIQRAILQYLAYVKRVYSFRANSGNIITQEGRYFKTGRAGCPEIIVCHKGRFIGLEVKTPTGRQSHVQKEAQIDIERAGGEYHIVRSVDDVNKIIK